MRGIKKITKLTLVYFSFFLVSVLLNIVNVKPLTELSFQFSCKSVTIFPPLNWIVQSDWTQTIFVLSHVPTSS